MQSPGSARQSDPLVARRNDGPFSTVSGRFYRAVHPEHRDAALSGSRSAGRYSAPDQPTLYLSATLEGVAAAMIAHRTNRAPSLEVVEVQVVADRILDLRDPDAATATGVDRTDAAAPWQDGVRAGEHPASWDVRARLESIGAHGLIDPSRQRPGLWHLVLFRWNEDDAVRATVVPTPSGEDDEAGDGEGEDDMDVETLTGLLRELEEHHARYEATAAPHDWQDWYAAYLVSREQGRTPEQASEDAGRHVEQLRR